MKVFASEKVQKADAYTMANEPVASVDLMERAAIQLADWVSGKFSNNRSIKIFVGPGNNGGDGWALARLLDMKGFTRISVYLLNIGKSLSPDSEINRNRLASETPVPVHILNKEGDFPELTSDDIAIDALFGTGLSRTLSGFPLSLVRFLNQGKQSEILSVDIPSGLFGENNADNNLEHVIKATHTLSFQFPKLSFFFPEYSKHTGSWHVLPIGLHPDFIRDEPTPYYAATKEDIVSRIKPREKFSHKGTYGHALLIAGSYGMMGAAILSAKAAVRAGAGLVTSHVPRLGVGLIQAAVPESLLSIDESDILFTDYPDLSKYSAVGIGPGINRKSNTRKALIKLLEEITVPLVLDADALNILAGIENWPALLPEKSILTPHPKEFERLFGTFPNSYERMISMTEFSKNNKCTIVLKGAHTCIADPSGEIWFNTTGNPGMATGGSGDVLTGLLLGLLAQGYSSQDASVISVWLHGFAGDLAAAQKGQHGLTATDIADYLGEAFCRVEKAGGNWFDTKLHRKF